MRTDWKTVSPLILAVAVSMAPGCSRMKDWLRRKPAEPAPSLGTVPLIETTSAGRPREDVVVVQMQFDVLRIELPADDAHHSEKTWNHVDEMTADAARIALLRRNGFRIGIASAESWPALRAVFEACGAKVARATHTARSGAPLTLDLGAIEGPETLFLQTSDDRIVGNTFDSGNKYIHLDYALEADSGGTTLAMTPEVHCVSPAREWKRTGDDLQRVAAYEGKVMHELRAEVHVPSGGFLVIGPDTIGATRLSVGHHFLTRMLEGSRYETVLCVTPQAFRTELAQR